MTLRLLLIVGLITSLLYGCGFKLKGQYYLPDTLTTIYVISEKKFSPLAKQVKTRLQQNQVTILANYDEKKSRLELLPERFQRRTLSLFPNGQVAEYELIYQVRYRVDIPGQETRSFKFELSREFQDDPNNALAKERERQLILTELRTLATERILSQLTTVR